MQNIVINMCEKFRDDWSRNDRALRDWKSDNNTPDKKDIFNAWRHVSGSKTWKQHKQQQL